MGHGSATLTVPAGLTILEGLSFRHAFLARKFGQNDFPSNPVLLEIAP